MTSALLQLAAEVHDELLKLVAPATPGTIEASSLDRKRNPVLFGIGVFGIVSFGIFIVPAIFIANGTNSSLSDLFQIVGAAGLGTSFYALYTASRYIKSGTFDPKYNNTYVIRMALGLLSGLILAYFLKDFLKLSNGGDAAKDASKATLIGISVSALALVGGYASEAVAKILDRVSETLVVMVSGSDKDKVAAAKQQAQADADKKTNAALGDTARKLQDAVSDPDPAALKDKVQKVMKDILGPR